MMSVLEVEDEIQSVFRVSMGDKCFSFQYLQSTSVGSKTLTIPSVSASFDWTAEHVARLGNNNKQAIYVLANDELACSLDSEMCYIFITLSVHNNYYAQTYKYFTLRFWNCGMRVKMIEARGHLLYLFEYN